MIGGAAAGDTDARGPGAGPPAALAVVLGALSVLAVPAGIAASRLTDRIDLVTALGAAVGVGIVLGLGSIYARRVARRRHRRSLQADERPLGGVRWLGWLGLYLGVMGGLALGVYAVLRLSE